MSIEVSVVMPVHNGALMIGEQLAALAAQDFQGTWEVIVADNGSTDDTRTVVEEFAATAPMPVTIADASARAGIGHARNSGALASRGRLIMFCDCDDRADTGWITAAVGASGRGDILAGLNRELTDPQDPGSTILNPGAVIQGLKIKAFIGCNFAVSRDAYFQLRGFDESLPPYGCDDIEFSVRADLAGLQVAGVEDMLMYFRRTTGTRALLRKVYLSAKAEVVLWDRHSDQFADRLGVGLAVRELLKTPITLARGVAGRGPKAMARLAVSRWGHLRANLELRRGHYAGSPILLDPRRA